KPSDKKTARLRALTLARDEVQERNIKLCADTACLVTASPSVTLTASMTKTAYSCPMMGPRGNTPFRSWMNSRKTTRQVGYLTPLRSCARLALYGVSHSTVLRSQSK